MSSIEIFEAVLFGGFFAILILIAVFGGGYDERGNGS